MIKKFKKEHNGSSAMETVILAPLMFFTVCFLLYYLFSVLTYISYNNVANSIAQELNMRQTGYTYAVENYSQLPSILKYRNSEDGNYNDSDYLKQSDIKINPETNELRAGTYFALNKHKNQFIIPFTKLEGVKVSTSKPVKISDASQMAGNTIIVEIYYTTLNFKGLNENLVRSTAVGYGVIS